MYQVYTVSTPGATSVADQPVVYQNNDISVSYYFWSAAGNAGFVVTNKTDEIVYIDLNKTFFVNNGVAYDYYLDRTITNSNSTSLGSSQSVSLLGKWNTYFNRYYLGTATAGASALVGSSKSEAIHDKEIVAIPAHCSKYFFEYTIVDSQYSACELQGSKTGELNFTESNSPIKFGNIISYRVGENGSLSTFENNFFVSQIKNIKERDEIVYDKVAGCEGKKVETSSFVHERPNTFYFPYKYSGGMKPNSVKRDYYEW